MVEREKVNVVFNVTILRKLLYFKLYKLVFSFNIGSCSPHVTKLFLKTISNGYTIAYCIDISFFCW